MVENRTPTPVFSHAGLYADDCDGIFCAIDAEHHKKVGIEFFFDTDYISSAHNKYVLNLTTNAGYSKRHVASAECGHLAFHLDEDDLQKKELLAELLSFFGTPIAKVRLRLNELDEYGKIYETNGLKYDADFDEALEAFINNYYCPLNYKKVSPTSYHDRSWAYFLYMTSPLSSFQYLWVVILQLRQA